MLKTSQDNPWQNDYDIFQPMTIYRIDKPTKCF